MSRVQVTIRGDETIQVNGVDVTLAALEAAAHQADVVWMYQHGLAVPPQDDETRALAARYREILGQVEQAVGQARETKRRRGIQACSGHRVEREQGPWGYTGSVSRHEENRAAHGNVGFTEICRCGAERDYLVNGHHVELGSWS